MATAASASVLRRRAVPGSSVDRLSSLVSVRAMLIIPSFRCSTPRSPAFVRELSTCLSALVGLLVLQPLLRSQPASQSPPEPTSLRASAQLLAQPGDAHRPPRHTARTHRRALLPGGPVLHP